MVVETFRWSRRTLDRALRPLLLAKAEESPTPAAAPDKPEEKKEAPAGERWITVHPNGPDEPGHPVLVQESANRPGVYHVIGGAGGKLTHMELHLGSPEEWAEHAKERRAKQIDREKAAGVDSETKGALSRAGKKADAEFVKRAADALGLQEYTVKTEEEYLEKAKGDKHLAKALAHKALQMQVKELTDKAKQAKHMLAVDHAAAHNAGLGVTTDDDPYQAHVSELDPGAIGQRAAKARDDGDAYLAEMYQKSLDAIGDGDQDAALSYLTSANRTAGDRQLTIDDVLGTKMESGGNAGRVLMSTEATKRLFAGGKLTPEAIDQRITEVTEASKPGTGDIAEYMGPLQLDALNKAKQAVTDGNLTQAGKYYLQAEKVRANTERFANDHDAFLAYQGMREQILGRNKMVSEAVANGAITGTTIDPDVEIVQNARKLLLADALHKDRKRALREARRTMDPKIIHSTVDDADAGAEATWQEGISGDAAFERINNEIDQTLGAQIAGRLDAVVDDPEAFLAGTGLGNPGDQEHLKRYVTYGRASVLSLLGEQVEGCELLPRPVAEQLGVKATAQLVAAYIATKHADRLDEAREALTQYHIGRQYDVANGALQAAETAIKAAKEYKAGAIENVDDLSEASRRNKMRMQMVDQALATLGEAYGELNMTAELNFALAGARKGDSAGAITIDVGTGDQQKLVNLATAMGLEPEDYRLTSKEKTEGDDDEEVSTPRGMELTPAAVDKIFKHGPQVRKERMARMMAIRRGEQDEDNWVPPMFAQRTSDSFNPPPADAQSSSQGVATQTLTDEKSAREALTRTFSAQPFMRVAFLPIEKIGHKEHKLLREYFEMMHGQQEQKAELNEDDPKLQRGLFGEPLTLADSEGSALWNSFRNRAGGDKKAISIIQGVLRGQVLQEFADNYANITKTPLANEQVPLEGGGLGTRVTLGPQVESQLGTLTDELAHRLNGGQIESVFPGMNMSGRFIAQQRAVKQLEQSGGLNGQEGGRLGGFLGTGCVRWDTPIIDAFTGEARTVQGWMLSGDAPVVLSLDPNTGEEVAAQASVPFVKSYEQMYEVTTATGRSVVVTMGHRFLTERGWRQLAEISVGDALAVRVERLRGYDVCRPVSSGELSRAMFRQDGLNSSRKEQDSRRYCLLDCRQGDELPLLASVADQGVAPSQGGAHERTRHCLREGGQGFVQAHNRACLSSSHRSKPDSCFQVVLPLFDRCQCGDACDTGEQPQLMCHQESRQPLGRYIPLVPSHESMCHEREGEMVALLADPLVLPFVPPFTTWDQIVNIVPRGKELVYDLSVPGPENYLADGIWHHNSGKTAVSIASFTNLLSKGKAKKAMYVVPSNMVGQYSGSFGQFIDPNVGFNWNANPSATPAEQLGFMGDQDAHAVVLTHTQMRDVALRAVGSLWQKTPGETATAFSALPRADRAKVMREAFDKMGWGDRMDFLAVDEGHQMLNRKGKEDSLMAQVVDSISDNSKYYLPLTGSPIKNDPSEFYDWMTKLRPDEYPEEGRDEFLSHHGLITSQTAHLQQIAEGNEAKGQEAMDAANKVAATATSKAAKDKAELGGQQAMIDARRNWSSSAAAEALQAQVVDLFYANAVPFKTKQTQHDIVVPLTDQPPADAVPPKDNTLPSLIASGRQKSAYDRINQIEQDLKGAAASKEPPTPEAIALLKELSPQSFMGHGKNNPGPKEGSEEEAKRARNLLMAIGMVRNAGYNRVLHEMGPGNAKLAALVTKAKELSMEDAPLDDNAPPGSKPTKKSGVIFTRSRSGAKTIAKALVAAGLRADVVTGDDSAETMEAKKKQFQPSGKSAPGIDWLVLTDKMNAGWDLPRGHALFDYDTPDTAKTLRQRNARIQRASSHHDTDVYNVISDTPYEAGRAARVDKKGAFSDVTEHAAETLDDTGMGKSFQEARATLAHGNQHAPKPKSKKEPAT